MNLKNATYTRTSDIAEIKNTDMEDIHRQLTELQASMSEVDFWTLLQELAQVYFAGMQDPQTRWIIEKVPFYKFSSQEFPIFGRLQ